MSGQGAATPAPAPKVRRNVDLSPSQNQRQGPIKAVKPFILKGPSSRSPSSPSSSVWARRSPVTDRNSPDGSSPFKVAIEKPKAVRGSPASSSSSLRRTGSLDTIGPYLNGQWPTAPVPSNPSQPMIDKTTQTPDDWHLEVTEEKTKKKKKHRRSASFGHADKKTFTTPSDQTLGLNRIRQKLQKTKDQGTKQRSSPIPANHNALLQTAPAVLMRSPAINIPIRQSSKSTVSIPRCQRSSVEGLNMEIEKLVLKSSCMEEEATERAIDIIPDGHRAPVPEMRTSSTRSIDTQTPSGILDGGRSSESPASRPQSVSPGLGMRYISGQMDNSPRPSSCNEYSGSTPRDKSDTNTGDSDSISPDSCLKKTSSSPKPNKIVREPPDGCEKVKVFDEDRVPTIKPPLIYPPQGQGHFILQPSSGSAFFPISRMCSSQGSTISHTSSHQPTIIDS